MEMVKVKVQTSVPGTFPTILIPATIEMNANRRVTRFPYGSIVPLWSRQIPYTVTKFYFFEKTVQMLYTHVFMEPKTSYSIVSLMAKSKYKEQSVKEITRDFGLVNLYTKGLETRIIMIGTISALQWWIYDTFKTVMGMGTIGGK